MIDAQCAKFNMLSKICEGCYQGYTLLEGRCEISKVDEQFEVKNCVAYNVDNKCIQCFDRFYLTNNQCREVSIFCKTYDIITGFCTSCYTGFRLISGQCKKWSCLNFLFSIIRKYINQNNWLIIDYLIRSFFLNSLTFPFLRLTFFIIFN